jgi:hypothetical protein
VRISEPNYVGTIARVVAPVQQIFHRVAAASPETAEDRRFAHLVDKVRALCACVGHA